MGEGIVMVVDVVEVGVVFVKVVGLVFVFKVFTWSDNVPHGFEKYWGKERGSLNGNSLWMNYLREVADLKRFMFEIRFYCRL